MTKLTTRAKQALKTLQAGGHWAHRLETNTWIGRDQFVYRLIGQHGAIKGYGFKTFHELNEAGLLAHAGGGTTTTYWKAKE